MSATDRPPGAGGTQQEGGAGAAPGDALLVIAAPDREEILAQFDRLIGEKRLCGAEMDPSVLKKSGEGAKFLLGNPPSHRKLFSMWSAHIGEQVSPLGFLERLSPTIQEFRHRDFLLLFAKDRIVYHTRIARGDEPVGEMTLYFLRESERGPGLLGFFKRRAIRIVYIDGISLSEQSSGYASALFRHYEELFSGLGFNQFRLNASLSVGKYYWAKEGFDCLDESRVELMREGLRSLVRERKLPVETSEIARLNHAYDVALFRRDLKVPLFRNAEGYYALDRDAEHVEEFRFPLGKAFLLVSGPWDGYKIIYTGTPRRTGFVYSDGYLDHRTRGGHVESPKRLLALGRAIDVSGLRESLVFLKPYAADPEFLAKVHDAAYIEAFRKSVLGGAKHFATRDCSISGASYDVALLAAGGVMAGIDAVMNRRVENVFCAVRPPGHHATRNAAMGFCFINNAAVGARYARVAYGLERVFILDWDVHHGNGTQEIFEEDPLTFFCSIHEHPTFCYPGTGRRMERGRGPGIDATLNLPLSPHAGDEEVIELFDREVVSAVEGFRPDLILISAGFDAHRDDPIADIELTERSYEYMTRKICEIADRLCEGRVVSILEGGYYRPSFTASAVAHLKALQGRS